MEDLIMFFKALSDETRVRLMALLLKRDYCVCELSEILQESQPKISKHLSKLRDIGFVKSKREAQYIYYQLTVTDTTMEKILQNLLESVDKYPILLEDINRIASCTIRQRGVNK